MWKGKTVSVVLPTYREKASIRVIVGDLIQTGVVDEIVVADNNAEPGTREEVTRAGGQEIILYVEEKRQGYGFSCQRGLREARGDLVILMEPDGTFLAEDIFKLLAFSEFDAVFGTRTRADLIWEGAYMTWLLRFGNWAVAKLIQVLFNTPSITDVGCTMRLIHRQLLDEISSHFSVGGNHFSPEMMILVFLRKNYRAIEVPVNFLPRVGKSMGSASYADATKIALRMIDLTLRYRVREWLKDSKLR